MAVSGKHSEAHGPDKLGFDRLVFFSDAVMAIAITLMALEVRFPEIESARFEEELPRALTTFRENISVYVISFIVIGVYWLLHHRLFRLIRTYDTPLMLLNLLFLMFTALVPTFTNVLGRFPNKTEVIVLYAVLVALMGVAEYLTWTYAQRGLLVPGLSRGLRRYISLRILIPPFVFFASIPVAILAPGLAELSWTAMVPLFFLLRAAFPKYHEERARIYNSAA